MLFSVFIMLRKFLFCYQQNLYVYYNIENVLFKNLYIKKLSFFLLKFFSQRTIQTSISLWSFRT